MLLEAQQHHFSAFVVKDHYCPTMLSAYIAEKYVGDGSCRVFGGIALNNSVGGINLKAPLVPLRPVLPSCASIPAISAIGPRLTR